MNAVIISPEFFKRTYFEEFQNLRPWAKYSYKYYYTHLGPISFSTLTDLSYSNYPFREDSIVLLGDNEKISYVLFPYNGKNIFYHVDTQSFHDEDYNSLRVIDERLSKLIYLLINSFYIILNRYIYVIAKHIRSTKFPDINKFFEQN